MKLRSENFFISHFSLLTPHLKYMKIKLIEFFSQETDAPKKLIVFMSVVSGLAYGLLIYVINESAAAASTPNKAAEFRNLLLFISVAAIFIIGIRYSLNQGAKITEEVIRRVRIRMIDKLRQTDMQFMESVGQGEIYTRITQDTETLSESTIYLISFLNAAISIAAIGVYILIIAPAGFLLVSVFAFVGTFIFMSNYTKAKKQVQLSRMKEAEFFEALDDVLTGFKEIKISRKKGDDLFEDIRTISIDSEKLKVSASLKHFESIIFYYLSYFTVIAVVLFVLPSFVDNYTDVVVKIIAGLLYAYGLADGLLKGLLTVLKSNVAVENLSRMEARLDNVGNHIRQTLGKAPSDFGEIEFHSALFRYSDKEGGTLFEIGPINLTIRKGEILFIAGGNGSGKSTFLKLLTGLYSPTGGGFVTLDDETLSRENYQNYRELFCATVSDFHLFRKLYGLESIDEQRVKELLKQMELQRKTGYADGKFTNLDLSTGQRKRLAYIAGILEDKPIYVFDEWAADQDPTFRKYFYETLIRDLKALGKTVIAVTHDDRYFDKGDRLIMMEEGKIVSDESFV